jgi:hypothetical protein
MHWRHKLLQISYSHWTTNRKVAVVCGSTIRRLDAHNNKVCNGLRSCLLFSLQLLQTVVMLSHHLLSFASEYCLNSDVNLFLCAPCFGIGGVALLFVTMTPIPAIDAVLRGKRPRWPSNSTLGEPHSRSGYFGEKSLVHASNQTTTLLLFNPWSKSPCQLPRFPFPRDFLT